MKLKWQDWSLAARITLGMTAAIFLVVITGTALTLRREELILRTELERRADLMLNAMTVAAAQGLAFGTVDPVTVVLTQIYDADLLTMGQIYDAEGNIIGDVHGDIEGSVPFAQQILDHETTVFQWHDDELISGQVVKLDGETVGAISIGLSTASMDQKLSEVRNQGIVRAGLAIVLGFIVSIFISRSVARPLRYLAEATERQTHGEVTRDLDIRGGEEITGLAKSFNAMTRQLRETVKSLEQRAEALQKSEAKNRALLDALPDTMLRISRDGVFIDAQISRENPMKLPPDLIGKKLGNVMPPSITQKYIDRLQETLQTQYTQVFEYEVWEGEQRVTLEVRLRASGVNEVTGIVRDVTESRLTEEALEKQREEYHAIFDTTPVMIWFKDTENRHVRVSRAAADFEGITVESVEGKSAYDMYPYEQASAYHADDLQVINSGKPKLGIIEKHVSLASGKIQWLQTGKVPYRDKHGAITGVVAFALDITERMEHEQERDLLLNEISSAHEKVLEASRLKSEFMATMSHELRTPLNAIIGYTEIQLAGMAGVVTEKQRSQLERILKNAENLLALINEILDLSKVEAGRLELVAQPFAVTTLVDSVIAQIKGLADEKDLQLQSSIDPNLPATLIGDTERFKQIAINLLSNAIKFTDHGTVRLDVQQRDPQTWALVVSDTGIGIPSHALDYIFDEFRQVDGTSRRSYGGSGLGLAIVRKLAVLMGGNVSVRSQSGEGSTFTVLLPLTVEKVTA